jgi:hypothetical protein
MNILIISDPQNSLADLLLESGFQSLISVTPDDVYLRCKSGLVQSGIEINCPLKIEVNIPKIKEHLLMAYPLIDRWVSHSQSVSTTIGLMLEYTISLIQIIGNYVPHFALLETGAPHHLETYCLDVALNYLNIKTYYLYGNAFDGRCLVVKGVQKELVMHITNYDAGMVIRDYVKQVKNNALYVPPDSFKSLLPQLHHSLVYAIYLHARFLIHKLRHQLFGGEAFKSPSSIRLRPKSFTIFEALITLRKHNKYKKILRSRVNFQPSQLGTNDIVYIGHMLPEATNFPESLYYPDEIDVLIDLKYRFPESKIYYREHPAIEIYSEFGQIHFQGLHKNLVFYDQLNSIGIDVIPHSMHISEIRKSGCLFATKTGRVAVENSILGIQTIIYGYPFYGLNLPLTHHVSKLPSQTSCGEVKDLPISLLNVEEDLIDYLTKRFSGSIANPGISLHPNPDDMPAFKSDFISLVKYLKQ